MDVELQVTEIETTPLELTTPNVEVCTGDEDIELVVTRKEFSIVGDSVYIGNRIDDTPQWLMDYIDTLNALSLDTKIGSINGLSESLEDLIDAMNVAKNAYTSAIITYEELETMVNAKIETLNSTLSGADATIIALLSTKVTPTEAQALATQVLDASIDGGRVKSLVGNVQEAIANETSARALDVDILTSTFETLDGSIAGVANASETLYTYVGLDYETNNPTGAGMLARLDLAEKQLDGVIEVVTGTYDVMLGSTEATYDLVETAEPYASWIAAEVNGGESIRAAHIGDTYIKYLDVNGIKTYLAAYKFIKTTIDATSPYGTDTKGYTWAIVTDTDTQNAYMAGLRAQATADGKMSVYFAIESAVPVATYALYFDPAAGSGGTLKKADGTIIPGNDGDELKTVVKTATTEDYNIYTKSGSWAKVTPNGLVAKSGWAVNLDSNLKGTGDTDYFGATSKIMTSTKTQSNGQIASAFAYGSVITDMYGNTYNAGFGLNASVAPNTNTAGTGTYDSEFWIKADKFKMVAASQSAAAQSPFSVNATTGDITFNGKVSFSSVTGAPTHTSGLLSARPVSAVLGSTYVATDESNKLYTYTATGWKVGGATSNEVVADINAGNTTTIDGGKITADSLLVNSINAVGGIVASSISVGSLSAISSNLGTINAGIMYNSGANESNYAMKIDLNAGEIHIK